MEKENEKIINFSEIIKIYKIKCYDELFNKLIIQKFENVENTEESDLETLLIGIPYKIKIIDKLNILILGYELNDKKILDYFIRNKNRINFFSLSKLSCEYYLKNYEINSNIIHFNFNPNTNEKIKKLVYFNKKYNIEFEDKSNNFLNFIKETDNICNIFELKLIIFEELVYIWDPYINILYESFFDCIRIKNFYQLNSKIYMKKFIDLPENLFNKYILLKKNIKYIINYVKFISNIPNEIKYIYSAKEYDYLDCKCEDIDKSFIIISDDLNYLESILKKDLCKIFISKEDFCLMKNNIIHIHEKFILNEISNYFKECKNLCFVVQNKKDIIYLENYLVFYKKYFPNKPIKIFASPILKIKDSLDINLFFVEENTKIFFPREYPINKFFNELIFAKNIEIGFLDKINVLVASTQYPSYGGAATNAYNIIRYLQSKNEVNNKILGLFINNNTDNSVINPDNLENICGISYTNYDNCKIFYYLYKEYGSSPDIAFCKNSMAPKIIKKIFPNAAIIFLVSGIMGFSEIECGANQIINYSSIQKKPEKEAILASDIVLCNSQLTLEYYRKIYKDIFGKKNNLSTVPLDTTKYNTIHINYQMNDKPIDIIIVASNVNRKVKNIGFVQELFAFNRKLLNYKIVIIGDNSEKMFSGFANVKILPLQKQEEVDAYLGKSKVILIPSLFDSNSNTFREAVMLDVIPIISVNVAHPKDYPEYFVVQNYNHDDWATKIIYTVNNFYELSKNYNFKKFFENNDQIETFL
jgi:hypothetical protein